MRGLKINKQTKRPDTPLANTPEPKMLSAVKEKLPPLKSKKNNNGGYATGVRISKKDELAHPEDFTYLNK